MSYVSPDPTRFQRWFEEGEPPHARLRVNDFNGMLQLGVGRGNDIADIFLTHEQVVSIYHWLGDWIIMDNAKQAEKAQT